MWDVKFQEICPYTTQCLLLRQLQQFDIPKHASPDRACTWDRLTHRDFVCVC
jgi:hypothetical protein